ncbi:Hypothetical protein FKW44_015060 [Caligus rogercresseyi]|uniref:Uncharacterized protein n=1 Tax=Caligus rogercresseyi TaxID=217165 RepID=A0A7T8H031_CALRO|nr:Hypothetical protein FKW44_015060 [Caligus rogercresseyi]
MDLESKRTAILKLLDSGQSHNTIMNMLGVSRTFIWCTKKVIKETGKSTSRPEQERKRTVRILRLTKVIAGKILRNSATP